MNTTTHCAGCRHDDEPLLLAEQAMVRLIALTTNRGTLTELSELMDEHDPMTVAAFALYFEQIDFTMRSLTDEFDRIAIDTFETWDQCAEFLITRVLWRGGWIGRLTQNTGRPFVDLLASGDEIVWQQLRAHGLLAVDTGEDIVLFRDCPVK